MEDKFSLFFRFFDEKNETQISSEKYDKILQHLYDAYLRTTKKLPPTPNKSIDFNTFCELLKENGPLIEKIEEKINPFFVQNK